MLEDVLIEQHACMYYVIVLTGTATASSETQVRRVRDLRPRLTRLQKLPASCCCFYCRYFWRKWFCSVSND
jgi:hypothetical protein